MLKFASLLRIVFAALVVVVLTADAASAQTYPDRVIKIIVPFAVGGQPDTVARVIAQYLQATVGTTIIENRPGNSTIIGSKFAADAAPDGYTLLFGSSTSLAIAPAMTSSAGYDPVKSFRPIAAVSRSAMYLNVGPSVRAKTVHELVDFAKANPGKLNFAAPPGPPHLAGEAFKRATGIDIVPVPYRTMNQAFTDLLSGQMDIIFDSPAPLAHLLREGKIRALIGLGKQRMALLPDVPTMAESGFPDLQVITWNGLVAPAGTPDAIIARLNTAVNEGLKSPQVRDALTKFSSEPLGGTPQDFAAMVAVESKKWAEIIRLAGVKID
ncbi:MAG: tripartite tricarboxylate transporter substrate binding protein [Rhizobiales bacterium]|nr:tripartite tricarboxylate transporter substrate binding protein [Hyphomicrobiales bacterium]